MGKSRRGQKELNREQTLKYENQKLRKEISTLRKQLARIDLDRYAYVRDIVKEHLSDEQESIDSTQLLDQMKAKWRCRKGACKGTLEIITYSKVGTPWYYRQCSDCDNRTTAQQYSPNVEGIKKDLAAKPDPKDKIKSFKGS